jgi:SAM-dependent methyltransferase
MTPADYDSWYDTPRGRWIGDREFALLARLLGARPGETLLDVGCGTGYFSRRFSREAGLMVTGIDVAPDMLDRARSKVPEIFLVRADAGCLPFADRVFDHVIAITSLCFVADEGRVLREMARVAQRRVVLGLLNRHSLLYWQKRDDERGGYAGARWHSRAEARAMLAGAGLCGIRVASAIFDPAGGYVAQALEARLPSALPFGGFIAVAGTPHSGCTQNLPGNRSQ